MVFLIEYDRRKGELLRFESFDEDKRSIAQKKRLELELMLNRNRISHEVVILEASSEEDLRKTHQRYFEGLDEIIESARTLLQTNGHDD